MFTMKATWPRLLIAAGSTSLLWMLACAAPDTSSTTITRSAGASVRRLPGVEVAAVRPVAERVFREHFRINAEASGPLLLVAQPNEMSAQDRPERLRDVLGPTRNRHRSLAELRLGQQGPDVLLRCVVEVQRLDTSERAAFPRDMGFDSSMNTPIDRQGATSADAREEWVSLRRDRELEQEILTAIAESSSTATAPAK